MDEGNISGFVGAEPGGGMEVSGDWWNYRNAGWRAGREPGAGMADTGILSYDSESAQAKEHAGTLPGGQKPWAQIMQVVWIARPLLYNLVCREPVRQEPAYLILIPQ